MMPQDAPFKTQKAPLKLLRRQVVVDTVGLKTSRIRQLMLEGLFPASIRPGKKIACWLDHEIQEWIAARVAGFSEDEMRALVADMHARRVRKPSPHRRTDTKNAA